MADKKNKKSGGARKIGLKKEKVSLWWAGFVMRMAELRKKVLPAGRHLPVMHTRDYKKITQSKEHRGCGPLGYYLKTVEGMHGRRTNARWDGHHHGTYIVRDVAEPTKGKQQHTYKTRRDQNRATAAHKGARRSNADFGAAE